MAVGDGAQLIDFSYRDELNEENVPRRNVDVFLTGIFAGFSPSIETTDSARFTPGVATVRDVGGDENQIRLQTQEDVVVSGLTGSTPYVVLEWEAVADDEQPVYFKAVSTPQQHHEVVTKGTFDGNGDLDGFDNSERDDVEYMNRFRYDSNDDGQVDDADKVDGLDASDASTYDNAPLGELIPKSLIDEKIETAAQGIEGAVPTVDDLPTISTANDELEEGDLYVVEQNTASTTHSNVQAATGESDPYPAGLWKIVDTDDDGTLDEWQFLTDLGEIGQSGMKSVDVFVANEGDTTFTPSTTVESDGSNSMVFRQNGLSIVDRDYSISNGDVVFDSGLNEGEVVVVFVWKSFGATNQVVAHAGQHAPGGSDEIDLTGFTFDDEGTLPAGNDTITLAQNAQGKQGMDFVLGGVPQPDSAFTFNAPNQIVVDETFTSDKDWHVEAVREL